MYDATDPTDLILKSHIPVDGDTDSLAFFPDDNYLCTGSGRYGIAILNITIIEKAYLICTKNI